MTPGAAHAAPGLRCKEAMSEIPGFKRGRVTEHKGELCEVTYTDRRTSDPMTRVATRFRWESDAAPHFVASPDNWLAGAMPALPSLTTTTEETA